MRELNKKKKLFSLRSFFFLSDRKDKGEPSPNGIMEIFVLKTSSTVKMLDNITSFTKPAGKLPVFKYPQNLLKTNLKGFQTFVL